MFGSKYRLPELDYMKFPGNLKYKTFSWDPDNISYALKFGGVSARLDFEREDGIFRSTVVHFARKGREYLCLGFMDSDGESPLFQPVHCIVKEKGETVSNFSFDEEGISKWQRDIARNMKFNTDHILLNLRYSGEGVKEIKRAICETETPRGRMAGQFSEGMRKLFR